METMERTRRGSIEGAADRVQVLLFSLAVCTPLVVQLSGGGGGPDVNRELRPANPIPRPGARWADLDSFPERFDHWFEDAFGLRTRLLRARNRIVWHGLGDSATDRAVRGRNGWVYYSDDGALAASLGARPFAPGELEEWVRMIEARHAWCREQGMDYLFVTGPTKALVYPEYLPASHERVGPSRLEVLHDRLATTEVPHLDLRAALIAEKEHDLPEEGDYVYYPLGTHWTDRGVLTAYRAVIDRLRPEVMLLGPDDFERVLHPDQADSWASRAYIEDSVRQNVWKLVPIVPLPKRLPLRGTPWGTRFEKEDPAGTHLVLHHDSFGDVARSLIAVHFSVTTCYWSLPWQTARIREQQPHFVVDLMVERTLHEESPERLWPDDAERLRPLFEASAETVLEPAARKPMRPGLFDVGPLSAPRGTDLILRIEAEAPAAGAVEVLVVPEADEPGSVRRAARRVWFEAGQSVGWTRIDEDELQIGPGRIQLNVERVPGTWTVHAIEARAVPAPVTGTGSRSR